MKSQFWQFLPNRVGSALIESYELHDEHLDPCLNQK